MFGMFLKSDWVVKLVIVLLVIFSIQSWKIIIQKILLVNNLLKAMLETRKNVPICSDRVKVSNR